MLSIVSIVESEDILGHKVYDASDSWLNNMYLLFKGNQLNTPEEYWSNVSIGDFGFKYGTPENPHDPIHLGFAATQYFCSSMNADMIAREIHQEYDGSTDLDPIFANAFPDVSGKLVLHPESKGMSDKILGHASFNRQEYVYEAVSTDKQRELRDAYLEIAGKEFVLF